MVSFPVWEAAAWRDFTLHQTRKENKFISFLFYLFINSISQHEILLSLTEKLKTIFVAYYSFH